MISALQTTTQGLGLELLLAMRTSAKAATVVAGIFDGLPDLDSAVERLTNKHVKCTVCDEAIVTEEFFKAYAGPIPVGTDRLADVIVQQVCPPNSPALGLECKSPLADFQLPNRLVEGYASTFSHKVRFVPIEADLDFVDRIAEIPRDSRAKRAIRHD